METVRITQAYLFWAGRYDLACDSQQFRIILSHQVLSLRASESGMAMCISAHDMLSLAHFTTSQ